MNYLLLSAAPFRQIISLHLTLYFASSSITPNLCMSSFSVSVNLLCSVILFSTSCVQLIHQLFTVPFCQCQRLQTIHHSSFPFILAAVLSQITPDTRLHPLHPACTPFFTCHLCTVRCFGWPQVFKCIYLHYLLAASLVHLSPSHLQAENSKCTVFMWGGSQGLHCLFILKVTNN